MSVQKTFATSDTSGDAAARKPRGRPRAYDKATALTQATQAFWQGGFAGTSLDDVSAATGMNRPSLYAAFGDKQALYLKLLAGYARGGERAMQTALAPDVPLRDGLMAVYDTALAMYYPADGPAQGCFLVGTGVAEAVSNDAVRAQVGEAFRAFDQQFEQRFLLARQQGELDAQADPAMLARLASALLHTLAMRSRVGDTRGQLRATAQAGVALLCGPPPAKKARTGNPGASRTRT